jgi:hypothetical protein
VQGEQFAVEEVEVVVATVDLDEVVSWRGKNSSQREQASAAPRWAVLPALCAAVRRPGSTALGPLASAETAACMLRDQTSTLVTYGGA